VILRDTAPPREKLMDYNCNATASVRSLSGESWELK
jgi:hypothetical protein